MDTNQQHAMDQENTNQGITDQAITDREITDQATTGGTADAGQTQHSALTELGHAEGEPSELEAGGDEAPAEAAAEPTPEAPVKVFPPRRNLGSGKISAGTDQAVTSGGLTATRAAHWHQDGNALLTRESLAAWIERCGLVYYTPRAQQMGVPAPSVTEAVAGSTEGEPAAAPAALLAALAADGTVVPLNLLGVTGAAGTEVPDFVCSAAVFSFVFTLRGNKAWKTPPATAGAVKVSPLALAAYELLVAKGAMTVYDLTTELGKEVTGAAVLRAMNELWAQLRVLPLPAQNGEETKWELASARFTRQIKAGANAGQPTALSALISLYLAQALAAEETEVESFLSPLAPRSRIREVLHALLGARQLETVVVEGKTLLHIAGAAPAQVGAAVEQEIAGAQQEDAEGGSRIAKFAPKSGGKLGTGLRAKPAGSRPFGAGAGRGKPAFGKPAFGKPAFGKFAGRGADRPAAAPGADRERRPFRKPAFDKPWEDRPARPANREGGDRPPRRDSGSSAAGGDRPPRPFSKPGFSKGAGFGARREGGFAPRGGARPPFTRSAESGDRPERRERPGGAGGGGAAGGFKRPYSPRPQADGGGEERPRSASGKPAYGKPSFGGRPSGGFGGGRPGPGVTGAYPSRPRPEAGGEGEAPRKIYRKFDAPRGDKPYKPKPFGARPAGGAARPYAGARPEGGAPPRRDSGDRPFRSGPPRDGGDRPPSRRPPFAGTDRPRSDRPGFDRPRTDRPRADRPGADRPRSDRPRTDRPGSDRAGRPSGPPRGKGPAGPTSGPFAKFAGGNKRPFSKPGGRPAGAPRPPRGGAGGFTPTRRKGPEDSE